MSITVLECLLNAQYNLRLVEDMPHPVLAIGLQQLRNAITALDNGLGPNDVIQEHLGAEVILNNPSRP